MSRPLLASISRRLLRAVLTGLVVVDLFAGGGGTSQGVLEALGKAPDVAIDHDPAAIETHEANHGDTIHLCEDVFSVAPFFPGGRRVDLLCASPDCTHFSEAKGGKPLDNKRRGLAWVVVDWARAVQPRVIICENVEEFTGWGPLDANNRPIPERKGETFRAWVQALHLAGYRVEWRVLTAADYGAPTLRPRLFVIARADGRPIVWPSPTHGPGTGQPYLTADSIMDYTIPVLSIFATPQEARAWKVATGADGIPVRPLAPKTEARLAEGIRRYVLERPPFLIPVPPGGRDRSDLTAGWLAKHYGGVVGHGLDRPIGTITATDHHSLVTATLGLEPDDGAPRVAGWLAKFYGSGVGQSLASPLHTITTVDRFALVTVEIDGRRRVINDIGMRMLQPRELANGQGFPPDYILRGTKREQVARIGNSVSPKQMRALVAANMGPEAAKEAA